MTELQAVVLFGDLALILVMARIIGRVARAFGQPPVIGEIVGGILLGPTLFHGAIAGTLFPMDVRPYLSALASLGLVLFMFVVGLEFDFGRLRGSGRVTGATVVGSTLVPFGLGVVLALYLMGGHQPDNELAFVLFIGVAVSVTAFPVLARILSDRGMGGTLLGTIALSAAAICDLAAWTTLAGVQAIAGHHEQNPWRVALVIPYALVLFTCVRPMLERFFAGRSGRVSAGDVGTVLAGVLLSSVFTQLIGLHFVFGAFLFGLAMPRLERTGFRGDLLHRTQFGTTLLLPVYFIVAGLNVDLSQVGGSGLVEFALIMIVAITGKAGGTWLAARSQGLSSRHSAVLATLMNTRGLTELIALSVGREIGILDDRLYSLLVVMAVVTTAMTGPLLRLLVGRDAPPAPADARPVAAAANRP